MAGKIPTPRSYASVLGDMLNTFIARAKIRGFKKGGPILSSLEATAQGLTRSSQDVFNQLDADSLDRSTGEALKRHAADEGTLKRPATASSGPVSLLDTRFKKISTSVYPGAAAPNAGTIAIKVVNASSFPSSGKVYIGRGTVNYEGPLSLDSSNPPVNTGNYWTITLLSATQKFHDLNETIILAQGGDRLFQAGQLVQTAQGNVSSAVGFNSLYPATIPDGEVQVDGVQVICKTPGVTGTVLAGAITDVVGPPFDGAAVINPLPFTNGLPEETDAQLQERVRNLRASRAKATALALKTAATGVTSASENKTTLSASVVSVQGEPTSVFIDDGSGYEERYAGIASETLMDRALGGEVYFPLSSAKPIAKAFVNTADVAPFALVSGAKLSVLVAGILSEHSFSASEFRSIGNATAFEVVAAINGDSTLKFSARTAAGGTQVALFSRTDVNEDIEVTVPSSGINANTFLAFPTGANYTLRLYKNDQLLYKDGVQAVVTSEPQSSWSAAMASGVQLAIKVDGTSIVTYAFTDADFVAAGTGYITLAASNSLDSWVAVFNAKVPGITATSSGGRLVLTSNRGASGVASVVLSQPIGGTNLITLGMFTTSLSGTGKTNDYLLSRNTGQLKLATPLTSGDTLTAGSQFTRAYLQGATIGGPTITISIGGANLWVMVDSAAVALKTNLTGATTLAVSNQGNSRVRYTANSNNIFGDVTNGAAIKAGDSVVIWDPSLIAHGVWKISAVDTTNYAYFEIERDLPVTQSAIALSKSGMAFVRSTAQVQRVHISAGISRTLTDIASEINATLKGAVVSVYRNTFIRITTNSYGSVGTVFVAAADSEAQKLLLPISKLVSNASNRQASVIAGASELGTPEFGGVGTIAAMSTGIAFTASAAAGSSGDPITSGHLIDWNRRLPGTGYETYGANVNTHLPLMGVVSGVITPRVPSPQYSVGVGSIARSGSTVTVTIGGGHELTPGESIQLWPGEANFAAGSKTVITVTATTLTYTEAGAAASSTLIQNVVKSQEFLVGDRFWASNPYAIGPTDQLNVVLNTDTTKTYALPMWRSVKPSVGATYGSTAFGVTDTDNAGATLATAFGTTDLDFFRDFAVYMHARGKSHAIGANKSILWRYVLFGAAGNSVRVEYTNPTGPSLPISLTTSNGQFSRIYVSLPSGALRTGLNLSATTKFTASVVNSTNVNAVSIDTVRYTYSKPSIAIGSLVRAANVVTADTSSNHGFAVGDTVYLTSSDVNFPAGAKTVVTAPTSTQFTYNEAGSTVASTAITTVSSASIDATLGGLTVGDVVNIGTGTAFPAAHAGAWRISATNASYFEIIRLAGLVSAITTPVSIVSTSNLQFYPINTAASKGTDIVTWITANASSLITATLLDAGSGAVGTSTLDEYLLATSNASGGTSVRYWPLFDGINYVKVSNLAGAPNTISLKDAVTADLTATADFANEELRLVPLSSSSLSRWVNSGAVSGLYASGQVVAASRGSKLQLSSSTIGSAGAIQVTGGTANAATSTVVGTGSIVDTTYSKVAVLNSSTPGLIGGRWVAVQASNTTPKSTPWTSASNLTIAPHVTSGQWVVTLSGSAVWTLKQSILYTAGDNYVRIDRQGRFVAYTLPPAYALSSPTEGDWVNIQLSGASATNNGIKQVASVSTDNLTFWVENPAGVTESVTLDTTPGSLFFYSYDSVMPGDVLSVDTTAFGTANHGKFTVVSNSYSGLTSNQVIVSGAMAALGVTALGTNAAFVQAFEANPARLIKKLVGVGRNPSNADYSDLVFSTNALAVKMSAAAGSSVQALDKLNFTTSIATGADAYSYGTGLLAEVTKVLYGDPSNPSVYPGVVATGANVNPSGPLIKRVSISLAIRIRSGTTDKDILRQVQAAVASVINQTPLGTPIALGNLVAAAQAVTGVAAVSMLSPTFNSANDLIPVQANEKPRILNIDEDILVSLVGN